MWNEKKTFGISKRWHPTNPPLAFARNQNMGNKMEKGNWQNRWMGDMVIGECQDRQRKSCITNKL